MSNFGIVEGFFGPPWSDDDRKSYAPFLSKYGANFYIYAPKKDSNLRKNWRSNWTNEYLAGLKELKDIFQSHRIKFGIGLSPFALGEKLSEEDKNILKEKCLILSDLGIDILGIFFDDMKSHECLTEIQISVVKEIESCFKKEIIFCPTFYTFDPILEKVFGKMPSQYMESISLNIPNQIKFAWTGPKVISPAISLEHLAEVTQLIRRKPFIWENYFANDGPKNFKFLKLKPFLGRDPKITELTEGFAFNLMNQAQLSKVVFLSSLWVLKKGSDPDLAFKSSLNELCSHELSDFILKHINEFNADGLDKITETQKQKFKEELKEFNEPISKEISNWLDGFYAVDADCLTD